MTEQAAKSWLSSHTQLPPALDYFQRLALETFNNPARTLGDLADIIALDPGMSLALYQQVNSKLEASSKPAAITIHSAMLLLGSSAIADLVMQHKTLSQTHPQASAQQAYRQLLGRIHHLLAQLEQFISIQGIRSLREMRSAALLHNVGEIYACLFDYPRYQRYQANFEQMGSEVNSAKPVFGFDFRELGRLICQHMNLPPLVCESLQENSNPGRKARLIQLAADISHQAEIGWYHTAMKATQEVCADYLNQSIDGFENQLQAAAIAAARNCPVSDILPAAARLIMLTELTAKTKTIPHRRDGGSDYESRVQDLLGTPDLAPSRLIDLLLDHLEDDLQMSRVILLQTSRDATRLGARVCRGVKPHSSINRLLIDLSGNQLFRSLLDRPLGLWVAPGNYARYETLLPQNFKLSILSEDFYLMSLFGVAKPLGIVFCDRAQAVNDLDKASYTRFKAAVLLTGKALRYLGKRGTQNPG